MASLTSATEDAILDILFAAVAWANIADNTATSPLTNLYVSLHDLDPGDAGSQTTSETAYTNYARQAVARTTGGWTVSATEPTQVVNAAAITFPQCGATGDTVFFFGIGSLVSGAGVLFASGVLGPTAGPALEFTCTNASPGLLTVPGSAFSVNDRVVVQDSATGTLPTGFSDGTAAVYYVGTAAGTVISLSTTAGNANPVNTSSVGAGNIIKCTPLVIANLITPSFAASALKLIID